MSKIISASIDLAKLDKSRIIPGQKGGKYYNLNIIVNDKPNQFGKHVAICDVQTPEERTAKVKRKYLGEGKIVWSDDPAKVVAPETTVGTQPNDDLPF